MRVIFLSLVFVAALWIAGCASSPDSPSPVLEPVEEVKPVAEAPVEAPPTAPRPSDKLVGQLHELGYQGVGLEFEDPKVLERLEKLFAAPEARGLDLIYVYTGVRTQYDPSQKSLTLSGTADLKTLSVFLKKKVPKRPKPHPAEP